MSLHKSNQLKQSTSKTKEKELTTSGYRSFLSIAIKSISKFDEEFDVNEICSVIVVFNCSSRFSATNQFLLFNKLYQLSCTQTCR